MLLLSAFIYASVCINLVAITICPGSEIQDVQVQTPQPQLAAERSAQEVRRTLTAIASFLDRHFCPLVSLLVIPGALTSSPTGSESGSPERVTSICAGRNELRRVATSQSFFPLNWRRPKRAGMIPTHISKKNFRSESA